MVAGIIYIAAAMAGFLAAIGGLKWFFQPARSLRLSVFRPYRGDPWPRGVQEDDSVRYDWSSFGRRRVPIHPTWGDLAVSPAGVAAVDDPEPGTFDVEELAGQAVEVEPLHATVHRADA